MKIIRFRFAKQGLSRFISHLDLMRAVDRAVRRSGLPVALTEGFHPHYRISFGPALPLGATSTGEYGDMAFREPVAPQEFITRLNGQLAGGIAILDAGIADGMDTLGELITRASYMVSFGADGPAPDVLIGCWQRILMAEEFFVEREARGTTKTINIRPGIAGSAWRTMGDGPAVRLLLATGSSGNLRPEDALQPLAAAGARITAVHRDGLYGLRGQVLVDPFGSVCAWPGSD